MTDPTCPQHPAFTLPCLFCTEGQHAKARREERERRARLSPWQRFTEDLRDDVVGTWRHMHGLNLLLFVLAVGTLVLNVIGLSLGWWKW